MLVPPDRNVKHTMPSCPAAMEPLASCYTDATCFSTASPFCEQYQFCETLLLTWTKPEALVYSLLSDPLCNDDWKGYKGADMPVAALLHGRRSVLVVPSAVQAQEYMRASTQACLSTRRSPPPLTQVSETTLIEPGWQCRWLCAI